MLVLFYQYKVVDTHTSLTKLKLKLKFFSLFNDDINNFILT